MTQPEQGLAVEQLEAGYGDVRAVWDVSIRVGPGEVVALLGPNGAGKSTTVGAIAGIVRMTSGTVRVDGKELGGMGPHKRCRHGISLVPQGRRTFRELSVADNLRLGARMLPSRREAASALEHVYGEFPMLAEKRRARAGELSGGQQQLLAVAQALVARPSILMLDEPSAGLAPAVAHSLFANLRAIADTGRVGLLIVEQRAAEALKIANSGHVLQHGRIVDDRAGGRRAPAPAPSAAISTDSETETDSDDLGLPVALRPPGAHETASRHRPRPGEKE